MARDFLGCYLLASQALTAKGRANGRTYIGYVAWWCCGSAAQGGGVADMFIMC